MVRLLRDRPSLINSFQLDYESVCKKKKKKPGQEDIFVSPFTIFRSSIFEKIDLGIILLFLFPFFFQRYSPVRVQMHVAWLVSESALVPRIWWIKKKSGINAA